MGKVHDMRRASYTIEAAILVPLLVLIIVGGILAGIELNKEISQQQEHKKVCEYWAVEDFYKVNSVKEVIDD